ncbi:FAD binding domain-containing protein [Candidatus Synechococcus calcipolaris G9]|uniref:FAD binding domain-containing protein n=1 Tax=Candidatus Synechococcus calcipolaris G9 TaxID=1497997 RepID=A0ABT6F3H2_9SYNE|nr:FAD binding domain-containing protein [Candidatus Synechococcus calcipolaris]MDG2992397.1 FAD binding domain-containing protein [Candidatus Synechococcus calcipolaris G9]
MDLNTVSRVVQPRTLAEAPFPWSSDMAWLAGGTWLFSEPQSHLTTLVDLRSLNWPDYELNESGLTIGATCAIATLAGMSLPTHWSAAELVPVCCQALLASFKIWNEATVGGNICCGLPAGSMITLSVALDGVGTLWGHGGQRRQVAIADFITGEGQKDLHPDEVLRSIHISASAWQRRYTYRRCASGEQGRSMVFLVGTVDPTTDEFVLTLTAATQHPMQLRFPSLPSWSTVHKALDEQIPFTLYLEDAYRCATYRQHMTYYFAEQILAELAADP